MVEEVVRWLLLYDPGTLGFTPSTSLSLGSQVLIPFSECHLPGPIWVTLNSLRWRKGARSIRTNTSSFQLLLPLVSALTIPVAIDEVSMAPSCPWVLSPSVDTLLSASTQPPFSLSLCSPTPTLIALGGSNNGGTTSSHPGQPSPHLTEPDPQPPAHPQPQAVPKQYR